MTRFWVQWLPAAFCAASAALGQAGELKLHPSPVPNVNSHVAEPALPPAQRVEDARTHVRFEVPLGWNLARRDGERSTFHLDARTAPSRAELRAVADLDFNPFPGSTFSGALFYFSMTPHSTPEACAAQADTSPASMQDRENIGDVLFTRGHDEHGKICTEARDDIYTAYRSGSCVRFDLVVNSFCGGEVSGAQDLSQDQLNAIVGRLQAILSTVRFTSK